MMEKQEKDQKMMEQALAAQNRITAEYSERANQCSGTPVKMSFLNLLGEEHRIQHELLSDLHRRGWRTTTPAEETELQKLQQWIKEQGGTEGPKIPR